MLLVVGVLDYSILLLMMAMRKRYVEVSAVTQAQMCSTRN